MSFDPEGDAPPRDAELARQRLLRRAFAGPWAVVVGFDGRLSRLPFFGCGVLALGWLFMAVSLGTAIADNHFPYCGIAVILTGLLGTIWGGIAITIARVHDLGMSGAHVAWIYALFWGCSAISSSSFALEEVVCAVWGIGLGVAVWLLFVPGVPEDNRWGRFRGRRRRAAGRGAKS